MICSKKERIKDIKWGVGQSSKAVGPPRSTDGLRRIEARQEDLDKCH